MPNTFVISDTHFWHTWIAWERWFSSVEEMDEHMVDKWNSVVKLWDKVYHLGDVAFPKKSLDILGRLNGRKILIKWNHDIYPIKDYIKYFDDIRACHIIDKTILTHIPIHVDQMWERFTLNIHGHTHEQNVWRYYQWNDEYDNKYSLYLDDDLYKCVCVEQIDYTPKWIEELIR